MIEVALPEPLLIVTLSLPIGLSANATKGSARIARARHVKAYREEAAWAFRAALDKPPRLEKATVRARFYWPINRRRDRDNAAASLKPVWDGLQDAGVVVNDAGLIHLPPVFDVDKLRPRVEIEVYDVEMRFTRVSELAARVAGRIEGQGFGRRAGCLVAELLYGESLDAPAISEELDATETVARLHQYIRARSS